MAIPRLLFYKYKVPVVALSVGMFVFTPDMPVLPRWLVRQSSPGEASTGSLHLFQEELDLLLPSSPATALQLAVHSEPKAKTARAWQRPGCLTIILSPRVLRNIFLYGKEVTTFLFSFLSLTELCYTPSKLDSFTSITSDLSREYWGQVSALLPRTV